MICVVVGFVFFKEEVVIWVYDENVNVNVGFNVIRLGYDGVVGVFELVDR